MTHTDMDVMNVKFEEYDEAYTEAYLKRLDATLDDAGVVEELMWREEHGDEDKYLDSYWECRYDFDVSDYGPEDF